MSEHNTYELVKNADALGGSHVHAKWLRDHKRDEIRCRLAATQLPIGERLDVTQSTPPSMVARLLLAMTSLHADESEAHDSEVHMPRGTRPRGYCWKLIMAMSGTRGEGHSVRDGCSNADGVHAQ